MITSQRKKISPDCVMPDLKSMRLSHCAAHMKLNILVMCVSYPPVTGGSFLIT